jgi:SAM-dependent methyltransferase
MDDLFGRAVFFVSDAERSLTFYTESLGFTLDWNHQQNGRAFVLQVSLFGFQLILNQIEPRTQGRAGRGRVFVGLEDDQVQAFCQHVRTMGIATTTTQWGAPTLVMRDIDDNELFFWLPPSDIAALTTVIDEPQAQAGAAGAGHTTEPGVQSTPRAERPASSHDDVRARHAANRLAWNEGARHYTDDNAARVQRLAAGESNLHPIERQNLARLGPLRDWCRRAIHLQCASGGDTLSLLLEGAHEVVGIDISDMHIANAQWTAEQLNMPARWFCCDVLDVPSELDATADLVYTGRGALCWLHDLQGWARVVARLLVPGGVFSLLDDHPASWLFLQDASAIEASGIGYFDYSERSQGWSPSYIGDLGKPSHEHAVKHERLWTLADVFQALIGAGLVVDYFGEHPDEYWLSFYNLPQAERRKLPMTFSMVARKLDAPPP